MGQVQGEIMVVDDLEMFSFVSCFMILNMLEDIGLGLGVGLVTVFVLCLVSWDEEVEIGIKE